LAQRLIVGSDIAVNFVLGIWSCTWGLHDPIAGRQDVIVAAFTVKALK
jgi:hypothetical protein